MAHRKIPRRVFLKSLGVMLLVSGCSSDLLSFSMEPTATPLPTPTPTPLPRADSVAQTYLLAWNSGDYTTMYNLLAPESRQQISFEQFQDHYLRNLNIATVNRIETQLQSLLHDGGQAAVNFVSNWQTARFGDIQAENQMRLEFSEGRWGVKWQPTLVLPQLGKDISLSFLSEQPTRGNIYDSNFHALATQGQLVTIGVVPQFIEDEQQVLGAISQITGVNPQSIRGKISSARADWFVPIADVPFETSLAYDDRLAALNGVERRARSVRTYTSGDVAAHMVGYMGSIPAETKDRYVAKGYTGDEVVGLSGVEAWAEPDLAGLRGGRLVTLSPPPERQVLSELSSVTSKAGSSVYLTFDTQFQTHIEGLLGERKGAIIVMNPHTGAIYAMATYPRFTPAVFAPGFDVDTWATLSTNPDRPLLSRATQGTYPPGSIFKIVAITAALESLGLDPKTMFTCTGKWNGLGPEFTKTCWLERGHGQISLIDGLTQSCNIVFYEVGLALHRANPDLLPEWSRTFGLGARTNIFGLYEESQGVVPDNAWKQATFGRPLFEGDAVNSGIGQGYTLVTPLQIVRILAAMG